MRWISAVVASLILGCSASAESLRLGDLVGLSPEAVQARLGVDAKPPRPVLLIRTGGVELSFSNLGDFGQSAAPDQVCQLMTVRVDGEAGGGRFAPASLLVFRDGLLAAGVTPTPLRPPPPRIQPHQGARAYGRVIEDWQRSPWTNVLVAAPGELPLQSSGADMLERIGAVLAPNTPLARSCYGVPQRSAPFGERRFDEAGFFQGLVILPLTVTLPGLNAERAKAQVEGPRALAELHPGEPVPGGLENFVSGHFGVSIRGRSDGYAILVINLGALQSNNVSRMNGAAFVGVRDGWVEWVAPTMNSPVGGMITAGICAGPDGRPTHRQPGCTDYGFFSP